MRTFEANDYIQNIPNSELYSELIKYAKNKGVKVQCNLSKKDFRNYPVLYYDNSEGLTGLKFARPNDNLITFEDFFEFCENWNNYKNQTT